MKCHRVAYNKGNKKNLEKENVKDRDNEEKKGEKSPEKDGRERIFEKTHKWPNGQLCSSAKTLIYFPSSRALFLSLPFSLSLDVSSFEFMENNQIKSIAKKKRSHCDSCLSLTNGLY